MAFTWTNSIPTAGTSVVDTGLPLEVRLNLDSIRDSLCTTHYFSHNSAKYGGHLTTNYIHNTHYASLKSYDGTYKSGHEGSVKSHNASYVGTHKGGHEGSVKYHNAGYKSSHYSSFNQGDLYNVC